MKCKHCGSQLHEDAMFCHKCGKRVPVNEYLAEYENDDEEYEDEKSGCGSKVIITLLITLILLVLLGLAAVASYLFMGNQTSDILESLSKPVATAQPASVVATIVPEDATQKDTGKKATAKPEKDDDEYKHVADPEYKTYTDSEYKFSCSYPTHFEKYIDSGSGNRYSVQANDGEVTLKICAEDNTGGITLQQSMSMFKSKHNGIVEYSGSGETYYAIRINEDGFCYYKYLRSKNKKFYWFEFTYPEEQKEIYEEYIQHIYESFTIK